MSIHYPQLFVIDEIGHAGEVRRAATVLAGYIGLDGTAIGNVAIIATEAASNIVKHAGSGEMQVRACQQGGAVGVEILAVDRGPGMANVEECLHDGYSTQGTSGTGLGAMQRLAGVFDIYSQPGKGTSLVAQVFASPLPTNPPAEGELMMGVVQMPMQGEEACGDSWAVHQEAGRTLLTLADGLGHGVLAAEASRKAVAVLAESGGQNPAEVIQRMHGMLRSTRGAAVAVAILEPDQQQVYFAGLGNISAQVLTSQKSHQMLSHHGTVGLEARRVQQFTYPWSSGSLIILHSDGLATNWNLSAYPGLYRRHPAVIAGVLYRDAKRGRDDACVLVARQ